MPDIPAWVSDKAKRWGGNKMWTQDSSQTWSQDAPEPVRTAEAYPKGSGDAHSGDAGSGDAHRGDAGNPSAALAARIEGKAYADGVAAQAVATGWKGDAVHNSDQEVVRDLAGTATVIPVPVQPSGGMRSSSEFEGW